MILITMAHYGEAQSFIDYYNAEKTPHLEGNCYAFDQGIILITGEGIPQSIARTSLVLGIYPQINKVINIGVAGSLSHLIQGEIYSIRTVYHFNDDNSGYFQSFTSSDDSTTCDAITSDKRILKDEQAQNLKGHGNLVDRELWGVSFSAKLAHLPWLSYKLISDRAGSLAACEVVKEKSKLYSEKLLNHYLKVTTNSVETKRNEKPSSWYFTITQQRDFEKLKHKIINKYGQDHFEKNLRDFTATNKSTNKKASKELIKFLKIILSPWKYEMEKRWDEMVKEFVREDITVCPSPNFEDENISFAFKAKDFNDISKKMERLKDFPFKRYQRFINGLDNDY